MTPEEIQQIIKALQTSVLNLQERVSCLEVELKEQRRLVGALDRDMAGALVRNKMELEQIATQVKHGPGVPE